MGVMGSELWCTDRKSNPSQLLEPLTAAMTREMTFEELMCRVGAYRSDMRKLAMSYGNSEHLQCLCASVVLGCVRRAYAERSDHLAACAREITRRLIKGRAGRKEQFNLLRCQSVLGDLGLIIDGLSLRSKKLRPDHAGHRKYPTHCSKCYNREEFQIRLVAMGMNRVTIL